MREWTIFAGALERRDPAVRLAYLVEACGGDVMLRARMETLLRENEQLGSFLEVPACDLTTLNLASDKSTASPIARELGDYRILREIGRGGMGIVYEAEQRSLDRHVALKVLPAHSVLDPSRLERFQREARAAARLHHTNIVPIHGVGEQAGLHYFAMQFIVGRSLDHVLRDLGKQQKLDPSKTLSITPGDDHQPLPAAGPETQASRGLSDPSLPWVRNGSQQTYYRGVARIGQHAAEALDYAAQQGVLHRDIKPANIMLDEAGQVWVMDFGLAKLTDGDDLTQSGELLGTLRYMAPERFQGRFDARSDVYSLGLTLYEALTLRSAYDETDRGRFIAQILSVDPPPPRSLARAISRDLETIVLKAIAREPQGRYATAGELAADLGRFLSGRPIEARRVSPAERLWRWCRRNPGWAALTSLVVVLGLALLIISSLSAIWLGERAIRAEVAEQKMEQQLWISKRDQARALRMSRRPGQRIESLRAIDEAMRMPIPSGHSLAELRTEAIAALALPDIEIERTWPGGTTKGILALSVDPSFNHYARLSGDGMVTVSRVGNSDAVASWREASPRGRWANGGQMGFSQDGRYLYAWLTDLRRLVVRRWASPQPNLCYESNDAWKADTFCFTPDSTKLIHVAEDTRIVIVDLASSRRHDLPLTGMKVLTIKCAPDGRRLAIAGLRAGKLTIEIRDLATGLAVTSFPHPVSRWIILDWHPSGRLLATASDEADSRGHRIRLWDVSRGEVIRTFEGHKTWGIRCAFDAAGERLLSNDWDKILRVWEPSSGRQLLSLPAEDYAHLQVSPDGRLMANSIADTTTLQLLRLHGNQEFRALAYEPTAYANVVFHPAGSLLAVGNQGPVLLIDLTTGQELGKLPTADGDKPLLWDSSGTLFTFGASGLLSWPARADTTRPGSFSLGPARRLWKRGPREQWGASDNVEIVAIPDFDRGALLVNPGSPLAPKRLAPQQDVRHCAVSPNGEWVATGSHKSNTEFGVTIWQAASGRDVAKLRVPGQCTPTFSPDGRWLLTNAGGCRLWRVGTWTEGPAIGGPWGCFSSDGRMMAVEDSVGAVRLVETDTGALLVRLESPEQSRLPPQCFSPDCTRLIVWGHDSGSLHVWNLQVLREELAQLGLDWNAPSYPPPRTVDIAQPLEVEVLPGDLRDVRPTP